MHQNWYWKYWQKHTILVSILAQVSGLYRYWHKSLGLYWYQQESSGWYRYQQDSDHPRQVLVSAEIPDHIDMAKVYWSIILGRSATRVANMLPNESKNYHNQHFHQPYQFQNSFSDLLKCYSYSSLYPPLNIMFSLIYYEQNIPTLVCSMTD